MSSIAQLTLAEIAVHVPGAIDVFEKHGIDFYRGGRRILEQVCQSAGRDIASLVLEIENHKAIATVDYFEWPVDRLVDHIRNRYHSSEKADLIMIGKQLDAMIAKDDHERVIEKVNELFKALVSDLHEHSAGEEKELFPYLIKLAEAKRSRQKPPFRFLLLHNPIRILEVEHEHAGKLLEQLSQVTDNFSIPVNASEEYRQLMQQLAAFRKDFHIHIHLENNILFPKALELEAELRILLSDLT